MAIYADSPHRQKSARYGKKKLEENTNFPSPFFFVWIRIHSMRERATEISVTRHLKKKAGGRVEDPIHS